MPQKSLTERRQDYEGTAKARRNPSEGRSDLYKFCKLVNPKYSISQKISPGEILRKGGRGLERAKTNTRSVQRSNFGPVQDSGAS